MVRHKLDPLSYLITSAVIFLPTSMICCDLLRLALISPLTAARRYERASVLAGVIEPLRTNRKSRKHSYSLLPADAAVSLEWLPGWNSDSSLLELRDGWRQAFASFALERLKSVSPTSNEAILSIAAFFHWRTMINGIRSMLVASMRAALESAKSIFEGSGCLVCVSNSIPADSEDWRPIAR